MNEMKGDGGVAYCCVSIVSRLDKKPDLMLEIVQLGAIRLMEVLFFFRVTLRELPSPPCTHPNTICPHLPSSRLIVPVPVFLTRNSLSLLLLLLHIL